jgi:hypothetical protein
MSILKRWDTKENIERELTEIFSTRHETVQELVDDLETLEKGFKFKSLKRDYRNGIIVFYEIYGNPYAAYFDKKINFEHNEEL